MMFLNERRDFVLAQAGILIGGDNPVVDRMGFENLVERASWLAFIGARRVVHELADLFLRLAIPNRERKWFGGHDGLNTKMPSSNRWELLSVSAHGPLTQ